MSLFILLEVRVVSLSVDKEERSFLTDSCVQGATVPLSPTCIFHHTLPFLHYLAFPSPLNFHVVRADMAFLCLAHKALWCSVSQSWSMTVCVPERVCVPRAHACIHVNIGDVLLAHSPPSSHSSHTRTHHTVCDPTVP